MANNFQGINFSAVPLRRNVVVVVSKYQHTKRAPFNVHNAFVERQRSCCPFNRLTFVLVFGLHASEAERRLSFFPNWFSTVSSGTI